MKEQPTIIFLHIPKTAGTTLHSIMGLNYPQEVMHSTDPASPHPFNEYKALDERKKEQIKVLVGHFAFGIHELIPGDSIYITVLREPIDRMISDFYHIGRDPIHGLHELVRSGDMDLKGYLDHLASIKLDNGQTRMFAGDWRNNGAEICSLKMLERAKMNLKQHFAVAGLTERFDETLLLVGQKLEWEHLIYTKRNVTKNRPNREKISPEQLEILCEQNKYDLALYAYAQELFEDQIKQQGPSFYEDLKALQSQNASPKLTFINRVYLQIRQRSVREFARKWWQRMRAGFR